MLWRILDRIVAVAAGFLLFVIWNREPLFHHVQDDFDQVFLIFATGMLFLYPLAPLAGISRSVPSAFWAWVFGLPVLCGLAFLFFPHEYGSKINTSKDLVRLYATLGGYSLLRMIVTWNEEDPAFERSSPDMYEGEAGELFPPVPTYQSGYSESILRGSKSETATSVARNAG